MCIMIQEEDRRQKKIQDAAAAADGDNDDYLRKLYFLTQKYFTCQGL